MNEITKIINIVCLIIWIGWFICSIIGSDYATMKRGLMVSSFVCMSYYIQLVFGILKVK